MSRSRASAGLLAGAAALGLAGVSSIGSLAGAAAPSAVVYNFTGAPQQYVVPDGVCSVTVEALGAQGGGGSITTWFAWVAGGHTIFVLPEPSGLGARATSTVSVTPGESLQVDVGGKGDVEGLLDDASSGFSTPHAGQGADGAQWRADLSQSPVGATVVHSVEAAFAGSRISQEVSGFALGSVELVLNFIVLIAGSLFFAANPRVYERGFLLLIPRTMRPAIADALADLGHTLRLWLGAQIILMTTMGILVGVGLYIAGVPSSAALGLLAAISEFIPYVGPTAAMLPALGLAATAGPEQVVGALVTYAVVRLIQTNFITPYVQHRIIAIPPAITLFAILSIGYIFGLFGLFFSAAILVTGFTLVRSLYLREVLGEPIERPGESDS